MFKVIPILCLALVAVSAYDFSDTYYNQFLFQEYEMLNKNALSPRQRRDAEELSAPEAVDEVVHLAAFPEVESSVADDHSATTEHVDHMDNPATEKEEEHDAHTTDDDAAVHVTHSAPIENHAPVTASPMHVETTTTPKYVAPPTTHKYVAPTTTPKYVAPTTTHKYVAPTTTPKAHVPAPENVDKSNQCGGSNIMSEMKKDLTCCDANKHDPAYFAMIRGTKKECAKKLRTNNPDVENFDPFNCEQMEKIKDLIICESECVAKSLNMLDEHGGIKREAIIANFKKHLSGIEESKIKTLESYVDTCLNKIKDLDMKTDSKCSPAPMEFQHCMFGEMVVNCPAEHQINTARCQKIRERYSKGESLALGRHALHEFLHSAKRQNLKQK